jgi:hypothetical protein
MSEKLAFCLLFICLQGGIKDRLKVGGGGGGGGGGNWVMGHESERSGIYGKSRLVHYIIVWITLIFVRSSSAF